MPLYTADRRLWLTADQSRVVEDGDPEAAFQLISPGQQMPEARARKYGLIKQEAEVKALSAPTMKVVAPKPNKGK